MTAACAPDGLTRQGDGSGAGGLRWGASFLVVLALHGGAGAYLLMRRVETPPALPPAAAVMIDLAPMPAAPPAQPMEAPPAPQPVEPDPTPPPPEPIPIPIPEPPPPEPLPPIIEEIPVPEPPPPVVEPEVALPPPPPPVKPKPRPQPQRPVERVKTKEPPKVQPTAPPAAAVAADLPPGPPTAPADGSPSAGANSRTRPSWEGRLLAHLERHKRYPSSAQRRRQQGVAQVRFVIDRNGTVLSYRLERSSGHAALDEESTDLLRRASPLPAPPPEIASDHMELVVPVEFTLR